MNGLGRLMGLDYGEAKIGVSLSDPSRLIARPFMIVRHTNRRQDFAVLARIANQEGVEGLVVGLPTSSDAGLTEQSVVVIKWARRLSEALKLPVILWDESFSTAEAGAILRRRRAKRPSRADDDVAAAVILQEYLEAKAHEDEPGKPLDDFEDIA